MRLTILFLPGLVFGLILAGCDRQKAPNPQGEEVSVRAPGNEGSAAAHPAVRLDRSQAGTLAPKVAFEDPQGRPVSLEDFHGRPVLVNLWATWCAPCVVEMPSLDALARREGDALTVLALSQDFGGRDEVDAFFRSHGLTDLLPYLDSEMRFMTEVGVSTLPTTILYDSEGREVWRMTGLADWASEESALLIAEAKAG